MTTTTVPVCPVCSSTDAELLAVVSASPPGEKDYGIPPERYRRWVYQCRDCGTYLNIHDLLGPDYYTGEYNADSWQRNFLEPFRRIRSLPPDQSDNRGRVARVAAELTRRGLDPETARILDVGSGLCVFLAELREQWGGVTVCLDPDPAAVAHARQHAGVAAGHAGTLDDFASEQRFQLITFNKVLEHVPDPVRLLRQAVALLAPDGFIYLELPDGDLAREQAPLETRQEFFTEHLAVYSPRSVARLARAAGCRARDITALREPSGKCTVYAFLEPDPEQG